MAPLDPPHALVQAWLEHLTKEGRSHHTLTAYQRAWQHLTQWYQDTYGEACDPAHLIARDLRDWKSETIKFRGPDAKESLPVIMVAGGATLEMEPQLAGNPL